ncbi:MAG: peptidoglycan-associated lipoprotein Pal [Candidatus Nitrotoga sp.]
MKKIVTGVFLLNLLAACASDELPTEEATAAVAEDTAVMEVAPPQGAAEIAPQIAPERAIESIIEPAAEPATAELFEPISPNAAMVDPLDDPNSMLAKRSVFHSFNSDAVQSESTAIVQAHAKYLADNPGRKVRLEGNTDERGSSEYNLALGQRRANGIKKMLILGGADANQVEAVSFGEEKPKATAHNESAWSQNRRTDIVYRAK